ncbi:MAG: zinc ribbon domain-containing protein [Chloroflexi bacterium]|nr:MAG: zinc ribbon domain-containing protein [Chloroflexota bacterium]
MPIYEYRCDECGEKFDVFVRSVNKPTAPHCPQCGSRNVQKSISLFGVGSGEGSSRTNAASCGSGPI